MNDLPGLINSHSDVIIFTDDTSTLISNNHHKELNLNFRFVLTQTLKWFQATQLVLNTEKFAPAKSSLYPLNLCYVGQMNQYKISQISIG
jgi:hypothetical protein